MKLIPIHSFNRINMYLNGVKHALSISEVGRCTLIIDKKVFN